jgi:hypothetical protein
MRCGTVGPWQKIPDWGRRVIDFFSMQETLRELKTEVEVLTRDLAELKRKHGLVPLDVGLEDGLPWGLVGTQRHPFCPVCQAKGQWMPLPRETVLTLSTGKRYVACRACKTPMTPTATLAAWLLKGA